MMERSRARYPLVGVTLILGANSLGTLLFLSTTTLEGGRRGELVLFGALTGGAILVAGMMVLAASRTRLAIISGPTGVLDTLMLATVLLAFMACLIGLARENAPSFLIGDVYKLLLTPVVYFITSRSLTDRWQLSRLVMIMAVLLLVQQLKDAGAVLGLLATGAVTRLAPLFWIQNLAGAVAFGVLALGARSFLGRLVSVAGFVVMLGVGMASGFRTYAATLIVLAGLLLLLHPRLVLRRYMRAAVLLVALVGPAVGLILSFSGTARTAVQAAMGPTVRRLGSSLQQDDNSRLSRVDESGQQRDVEVITVAEGLVAEPLASVAGFGAGATFDLPSTASVYALDRHAEDGFEVHHIHNSFAAYAYRHGIVGLLYFVCFAGSVVAACLKRLRRSREPLEWFAPLVVLGYFLASPFFLFIPGDAVFAICLGMLAVDMRLASTTPSGGGHDPDGFDDPTASRSSFQ